MTPQQKREHNRARYLRWARKRDERRRGQWRAFMRARIEQRRQMRAEDCGTHRQREERR